ncbi:MAG: adenylosuccinate synthetase, partial [Enterococcus sp.]|nr:adenylosuccinate synthetase [Enterococcus sp.]
LITPLHVLANEQREINRGRSPHGSCGQGVGEARSYAIHQTSHNPISLKDLKDPARLHRKLETLRDYLISAIPGLKDSVDLSSLVETYATMMSHEQLNIVSDDDILALIADKNLTFVVEGSQGILLDEDYGFIPHTTWSSVVSANAKDILHSAGIPDNDITVIGISRTYTTRHGAGPFPSELDAGEELYPEKHNSWGRFQGGWRVGTFDLSLLDYAVRVSGGIDYIALTHCDITPVQEVITRWEREFMPAERDPEYRTSELTETVKNVRFPVKEKYQNIHELTGMIHRRTGVRVGILSYGPTAHDKRWV